jgi:hypothetical protein
MCLAVASPLLASCSGGGGGDHHVLIESVDVTASNSEQSKELYADDVYTNIQDSGSSVTVVGLITGQVFADNNGKTFKVIVPKTSGVVLADEIRKALTSIPDQPKPMYNNTLWSETAHYVAEEAKQTPRKLVGWSYHGDGEMHDPVATAKVVREEIASQPNIIVFIGPVMGDRNGPAYKLIMQVFSSIRTDDPATNRLFVCTADDHDQVVTAYRERLKRGL